jgi:hypothetical protein
MLMTSLCFALALLAAAPLGNAAEGLTFEAVVPVKSTDRGPDLLYVVLTDPRANAATLDRLVLKYAGAALREAATHRFKGTTKEGERPRHDGNVVFLVRTERNAQEGVVTGFSVDQLREIVSADPERARKLVHVHTWGWGKLPGAK